MVVATHSTSPSLSLLPNPSPGDQAEGERGLAFQAMLSVHGMGNTCATFHEWMNMYRRGHMPLITKLTAPIPTNRKLNSIQVFRIGIN